MSDISEARDLKFEEINVGDSAEFLVEVSEDDLDRFTRLSKKFQPAHVDVERAKKPESKERIAVPGMLVGCHFSGLLGVYLPGKNCLCLSQTLLYKKPVYLNQKIRIRGEVTKKFESTRMLVVHTMALDENGEVLVDGEAKTLLSKTPFEK